MRSYIIGDIHGCNIALDRLIDKLAPDTTEDRLILLGDLFDRGGQSWEVLETVKALSRIFGERFILLRGNHEDYLLQEKLSLVQKIVWERVGRRATINSFKAHGERAEDSAPWLKKHCRLYYVDDKFQCVHAGVKVEPVEANDLNTLLHDHDIVFENFYKGRFTITGHIALHSPKWFAGDKKTVKKLEMGIWQELPQKGILCIDTGCGKGGRLTGMVIDGSQFCLESVAES